MRQLSVLRAFVCVALASSVSIANGSGLFATVGENGDDQENHNIKAPVPPTSPPGEVRTKRVTALPDELVFWANRGRRTDPEDLAAAIQEAYEHRLAVSKKADEFVDTGDAELGCTSRGLRQDSEDPFWGIRGRRNDDASIFWGNRGKRGEDGPFWGTRGKRGNDGQSFETGSSDESRYRDKKNPNTPFWTNREERADPDIFWGSRGRRSPVARTTNLNKKEMDGPFWGNRGKRENSEPFWGARGRRDDSEPFWGARGRRDGSEPFWGARGRRDGFEPFWGSRGKRGDVADPFWGTRGKKSDLARVPYEEDNPALDALYKNVLVSNFVNNFLRRTFPNTLRSSQDSSDNPLETSAPHQVKNPPPNTTFQDYATPDKVLIYAV